MGLHGTNGQVPAFILAMAFAIVFSACSSSGDDGGDYVGTDTIPDKLMIEMPASVAESAAASMRAVNDPEDRYKQMRSEFDVIRTTVLVASIRGAEVDEVIAQNGLTPSATLHTGLTLTTTAELVDKTVAAMQAMGILDTNQETMLRAWVGETETFPDFTYSVSVDPSYAYSLSVTESASTDIYYWTSGGNTKYVHYSYSPGNGLTYKEVAVTYDNALKASSFLIYQKNEGDGGAIGRIKAREDGESAKSGVFYTAYGTGHEKMTVYADNEGGGMNVEAVLNPLLPSGIEYPAISCTFNTIGVTDTTGNGTYKTKVDAVDDKIVEIPEINPLNP